jgi:hypothetical protein
LSKAVDYDGALKVFDALEAVDGTKPFLVLVSVCDARDLTKIPGHYVSGTDSALTYSAHAMIG